jgi:LmbE family N-acetylglucosaminyl deacetylase
MIVFAIGCHPDDIEFMMGGTLLLLRERSCEIHYLNIANGSCGTQSLEKGEIIRIRRAESTDAARALGAVYHDSLCDDLAVFYTQSLISRVAAVIRRVKPDVVLTLSPEDYMEDHMNAGRIAATASFVRGMRNYAPDPPTPPYQKDIALYHALPYGLTDRLRKVVLPEFYVDTSSVIEKKTVLLAKHASQKEWLDKSQGIDSYLIAMKDMSRKVGQMSGRFDYAEGWRRHSHLGYSAAVADPIRDILADYCLPESKYYSNK